LVVARHIFAFLNGTFHRLWKNRNSSVIPIVAETLEQEGELLFGYEKDKRGGGFEISQEDNGRCEGEGPLAGQLLHPYLNGGLEVDQSWRSRLNPSSLRVRVEEGGYCGGGEVTSNPRKSTGKIEESAR
jgi:hypothetical protein